MSKIYSSLNRERYGPIILSVLSLGVTTFLYFKYNFSLSQFLGEKKAEFLSVGISLGAIWAGFIGVIIGLLITLSNTDILEKFKESGYIDDLHKYLITSIKGAIVFSIVSFFGFFF